MCMLNLSHRILYVHPKDYASLLQKKKKEKERKRTSSVLLMAKFCLDLLIPICTSCFTYSVRLSYWPPLVGAAFHAAGADLQVSRSPAQGPGYQLKSSLASELLSVYLSHVMYTSVCLILLSVLEVCGQSVYMGPTRNSVYALWFWFNIRLATCLAILFIYCVY